MFNVCINDCRSQYVLAPKEALLEARPRLQWYDSLVSCRQCSGNREDCAALAENLVSPPGLSHCPPSTHQVPSSSSCCVSPSSCHRPVLWPPSNLDGQGSSGVHPQALRTAAFFPGKAASSHDPPDLSSLRTLSSGVSMACSLSPPSGKREQRACLPTPPLLPSASEAGWHLCGHLPTGPPQPLPPIQASLITLSSLLC